jgi:catechol 2,3-dioxygenase-like lactoylglutathione lyase family enzyme
MIRAKSRGLHHVGFTVPDIDEAIRVFETIFGCVKVFTTGPSTLTTPS